MAIEQFSKDSEYFFLSSMAPIRGGIITEDGVLVSTAEHDYQASKFEDAEIRALIYAAPDGYDAKKIANKLEAAGVPIRPDWEEVKIEKMREAVARKFASGTRLAHLLWSTGDEEIVEGNNRGDTFWGVCPPGSRNGHNWLGRILMERRDIIKNERLSHPTPGAA